MTGATLVIAKLDRFSRNAAFLLTLRDSGLKFLASDMTEANDLTVGIMAVVAQQEREAISLRTKEALAAAKARGVKLGNPNGAAPLRRAAKGNEAAVVACKAGAQSRARELAAEIEAVKAAGAQSLREIAHALNERHIAAPRGGSWHPVGVKRVLHRLGA